MTAAAPRPIATFSPVDRPPALFCVSCFGLVAWPPLADGDANPFGVLRAATFRHVVDVDLFARLHRPDVFRKRLGVGEDVAVHGDDLIADFEPRLRCRRVADDALNLEYLEAQALAGDVILRADLHAERTAAPGQGRGLLGGLELVAHLVVGRGDAGQGLAGDEYRRQDRDFASHRGSPLQWRLDADRAVVDLAAQRRLVDSARKVLAELREEIALVHSGLLRHARHLVAEDVLQLVG